MSINLTVVIDNDEAIRKFRELQKTAKTVTSNVVTDADRMDIAMRRLATTLGQIGVGVSLAGLVKQIAQTRGEFQQLEVAFTTLLQSKEKADALMSQMVELAAKTPFDLQGVASGARQLLAYGFAAEDITDTLTRLGNVAAGLGLNLQDLTWLYGTTAVQGRLYTRDVMQFQSRGIDLAGELATQLGKTRAEISQMVTEGKIGFPEVQKAIESMTNEGGKFHNLMQEQSKTITGLISNLGDALDMMFNDLGKSQEGIIAGALKGTISLVENYNQVLDIVAQLVVAYGTYKAALVVLTATERVHRTVTLAHAFGLSTLQTVMGTLTKKTQALNAALMKNPYVLIAAAASAFAVTLYKIITAKSAEEIAYEKVNAAIDAYNQKLDEQKNKAEQLHATMQDEVSTAYTKRKAYEELIRLYPELLQRYSEEEIKLLSLIDLTKELNDINDTRKENNLQEQYDAALENVQRTNQAIEELGKSGGGQAVFSLSRALKTYEAELDEVGKRLDEFRKTQKAAEWDAAPAEVKIATLQGNIDELKAQNAEIDRLIENARNKQKEAPYLLPLYGESEDYYQSLKQSNLSQIATKQNEISSLRSGGKETNRNKSYWEGQKKEAEAALEAMDISLKGTAKWNELIAKIAEYDSKIKQYSVSGKTVTDAVKAQKKLSDLILANDTALKQSRIDIMKDGLAKELAQIDLNAEKTKQAIEERRKKIQEAEKGDTTSDRAKAKNKMQTQFNGNVDLLARPLINAAELVKKGWEDAGEGIATVFSSQYGILDASGKEVEILVTPILPNGDVMSPQELEDYIFGTIEGARDILKADTKGIVIATNVSQDGKAGELLHQYQEEYYAPYMTLKEEETNADSKAEADKIATKLKYAQELDKIYKQITDDTLSEEDRRIKGIKDKYEEFRKWVEDALKAGNITKEQATDLGIKIDQAEIAASLNTIVEKYGTMEDKIAKIREKHAKDRETATKNGRSDLIPQIDKHETEEIGQIKVDELMKTEDWINLFQNLDALSSREILRIIDNINRLLQDADLDPINLKTVTDQLDQAADIATRKNPFASISANFKAYKKALADGDDLRAVKLREDAWQAVAEAIDIVAASISGVSSIASALGADEDTTASINNIAGAVGGAAQAVSGFASGNIVQGIQGTVSAITSLINLFSGDRRKERNIQRLQDQIDALEKSYDELGEAVEEAYSTDASELIEQQNELLEQQKILIQNQIAEERSKKDTDEERIKEWENQIDEINKQIEENKEKALDAIFGEDLKSAIDNFATAYADAWANGEDRARTARDVVRNMMRQMVIESIKSAIQSSEAMKKIREKLQEFWLDGVFSAEEQEEAYKMADDLQKYLDDKYGWAGSLLFDNQASTQNATSRGFQAMSQDTGDELNGRFTDMQGKMNILVNGMELLRSINMDTRNVTFDIRDIMIQLNGNVADIRTYTRILPAMGETLVAINRKLDNL